MPRPEPPLTVGIDGCYVRQWEDKKAHFEVIVGKSMSEDRPSRCFGFVQTYDEKPKRRVFELLKGQGVAVRAPTTKKSDTVKVHWPYVLTEAFFVVYQLGWAVLFATNGLVLCTIGAAYVASCVVYLGFFYGDHLGKVCFAFDRSRRLTHDKTLPVPLAT